MILILIYQKELKLVVEKQTIIKISGSDKQQVGMVVSKIKIIIDHQNHIKEKELRESWSTYTKKRRKERNNET